MRLGNDYPRRHNFESVDTLKLFFRDVADIPILAGYADYLPLTRRIERGRHITASTDNVTALDVTKKAIQEATNQLATILGSRVMTDINPEEWGDIDRFLDDVTLKQPIAADNLLSANEAHDAIEIIREQVWTLCYMFSVLPSSMRCDWQTLSMNSEIDNRFVDIRVEVKQCKHDLTQGTLRYAINIARLYLNTSIPFEDILQQGLIGLMYAAEKYQEFRMTHFQHYSANWIRQQISRYIADHSRLIRIPVHLEQEINLIDKFVSEYLSLHGDQPSETDIFLAMGWIEKGDIEIIRALSDQKRLQLTNGRLEHLQSVIAQSDLPMSEVNSKTAKLLDEIDVISTDYETQTGQIPSNEVIAVKLGWLTSNDISFRQQYETSNKISSRKLETTRSRFHKAQRRFKYYQMAKAKHYSIEMGTINMDGVIEDLRDVLPAEEDVAWEGDKNLLADRVNHLLWQYLKPREIDIISRRFGIFDGIDYTLEEIGTEMGVTRERIRQIESKALKRLSRRQDLLVDFLNSSSDSPLMIQLLIDRLLSSLDTTVYVEQDHQFMKRRIEKLIDVYIERGSPRRSFTGTPRYVYIEQVLQEAGAPLHHKEIYQRVLTKLPPEIELTEKNHYAALFYSDKFHGLGDGVFALSSWVEANYNGQSDKRITHFPEPLRPVEVSATSFFESVIVGRNLLQKHSMTARQFLREMQAWAGRIQENWIDIQNAFDAWYVAGLIDRIDFQQQADEQVVLTLSTDARMNEVRMMCLNNIAHRVAKIPELLLTLKRIAPASIPDIQKVLFGSAGAGYDVPIRLEVLAAFEAVQQDGNAWRITSIGEQTLEANHPQELPDFSIIEEAVKEVTEDVMDLWEDDLGLVGF
jgi:RNA polymerase sigma factor (sigma-70 family)